MSEVMNGSGSVTMEVASVGAALEAWSRLLGVENVRTDDAFVGRFRWSTTGRGRDVPAVIRPSSTEEVSECLRLAVRHGVPLHVVSTGRNWGYGGGQPVRTGCVVMKLGRMNRILAIDEKMGTVTLEPGVRQIDLYRAFRERGLDFMVPTTGAGPECSILGNALERGYGITPHEDHFLSLISLKAVLADGRIYQSALRDLGGERSDDVFKWKIGPFLEGLFTQSNLGVVTQATIALARKPEEVAQFIAFLDDASLEEAVARVSVLKQTLGSVVGGVNLMNRRRMLSMITASSEWSGPDIVPEERVAAQGRRQGISDWMLLGALYGPREMVDAAYRRVRRELRSASRLTLKVTRRRLGWAQGIARWLPATWKIQRTLRTFAKALDVLEGIPSDVALPLAYLKNPQAPVPDELSRRIDECGLLWFAPLVPADPALVRSYVEETRRICTVHRIEPLITLTTVSERCFDSTVPLLFDRRQPEQVERAEACLKALLDMARSKGVFPYRMDVERMTRHFGDTPSTALDIYAALREKLDPAGILSPGRYARADVH